MRAMTIGVVVMLLGATGFAQAEGNERYNGRYLVKGATHMAPSSKSKSKAAKQPTAPQYNPKELSVDQSVPWQKAPKNSSRQMKSRSPHLMD